MLNEIRDRLGSESKSAVFHSRGSAESLPLMATRHGAHRAPLQEPPPGKMMDFETIVHEHNPSMLGVARRITNCEADAEDCIQESLAKVFQKIGTFEGRSSLKTWLHRIVVNQSLMNLRKQRRHREVSIDDPMAKVDLNRFSISPDRITDAPVDELLHRTQIAAKVRQAIAELPDSYRAILELRDLKEFSTAETARRLEITDGLARTRLHRARAALKKKLDPFFGTNEGQVACR